MITYGAKLGYPSILPRDIVFHHLIIITIIIIIVIIITIILLLLLFMEKQFIYSWRLRPTVGYNAILVCQKYKSTMLTYEHGNLSQ